MELQIIGSLLFQEQLKGPLFLGYSEQFTTLQLTMSDSE